MNDVLNTAGQVFRGVIGLAALLLHEYVRYRQRYRPRKKAPLRRLTHSERRARYMARKRHRRSYTGETQRLE